MAYVQLITFELSGEEYGIKIDNINGIIKSKSYKFFNIPDSQQHIEGIINLRGKVTPIINLKKKFQLTDKQMYEDNKIIIVNNQNNSSVGFLVDEVTDIFRIDESNIDIIQEGFNDYITGFGKVDDRVIIILDLVKLLSNDDHIQFNRISNLKVNN